MVLSHILNVITQFTPVFKNSANLLIPIKWNIAKVGNCK